MEPKVRNIAGTLSGSPKDIAALTREQIRALPVEGLASCSPEPRQVRTEKPGCPASLQGVLLRANWEPADEPVAQLWIDPVSGQTMRWELAGGVVVERAG